ncbi:proline dehydrogenase [Taxawa tesnikishii (nom. ined.)]|nr:proline dehydrogenase [Dothideales sp. JES 119]
MPYLKASPQKLLDHLQLSREQGFVLGAKIVRGAYLHTEPVRSAIHNTKKDTDAAYDAAISYLLMGKRSGLFLGAGSDPDYLIKKLRSAGQPQRGWVAEIVVASHNTETVKRALALLQSSGDRNF